MTKPEPDPAAVDDAEADDSLSTILAAIEPSDDADDIDLEAKYGWKNPGDITITHAGEGGEDEDESESEPESAKSMADALWVIAEVKRRMAEAPVRRLAPSRKDRVAPPERPAPT